MVVRVLPLFKAPEVCASKEKGVATRKMVDKDPEGVVVVVLTVELL